MVTFTDGFCSGFRKVCWAFLAGAFLTLAGMCLFLCFPAMTAEAVEADAPDAQGTGDADVLDAQGTGDSDVQAADAESVMKWLVEKAADDELDIGDEDSIRQAIADGEQEFHTQFTDEEKERIVAALQKVDSFEVSAEEMLAQAQELYRKYGTEVVTEANEVINEAVGEAVEDAAKSFWKSVKEAVESFFKNLFNR